MINHLVCAAWIGVSVPFAEAAGKDDKVSLERVGQWEMAAANREMADEYRRLKDEEKEKDSRAKAETARARAWQVCAKASESYEQAAESFSTDNAGEPMKEARASEKAAQYRELLAGRK